jgi:phage-related protein (TIGR01555 family)
MGRFLLDSLANFVTGMGAKGRDATLAAQFVAPELNMQEVVNAYRGDWITRKAIDIIPYDGTREWRNWQADKDDITKIEELEKKLNLVVKTQKSWTRARLFGGCVLVLGVDDGNPEEPLDPAKVGKDKLKFIHVISRNELTTGDIITDVNSQWYGQPAYYERKQVAGTIRGLRGATTSVRIHPSRVIMFCGQDRPDDVDQNDVWGDSVLYSILDAIKQAGTVQGSIAAMIQDARLDIIRIPDFTETVSTEAGAQKLTKRFQYASMGKSIVQALMLDKEEEWNRNQTSFTGMPEVMQMYLMIASAAVDVPATRFLSQDPKGLNATGAGDIRNYYDRVSSDQRLRLTPAMQVLDEVLVRSALGTYPEGIFYNWNPLWQLDAKEKSEVAKNKSEVAKADYDMGVIPNSAFVKARQNQLIEDGTYPGLEEALKEAEAEGDVAEILQEPDENDLSDPNNPNSPLNPNNINRNQPVDPNAPPQPQPRPRPKLVVKNDARANDATALPLRIYREVMNADAIVAWAKTQNIVVEPLMLHVVLVETKLPVDWMKMGTDDWGSEPDGSIRIPRGGPRVVDVCDDGALALLFASNRLRYRHSDLVRSGAAHEYNVPRQIEPSPYPPEKPTYEPRIILRAKVSNKDMDISKFKPYTGEIVLGPEIFEDPINGDDD